MTHTCLKSPFLGLSEYTIHTYPSSRSEKVIQRRLQGQGSRVQGAPGARKFREFRNFRCWWGRGPPPPTLSLPLSLALLIRLSPHLFYLLFLSRPPSSLPHMLDHSGSFGWSTREVPSVSTSMSTGKSTEKAMHMMTHTSMWVPHQKYILYVSYVLCVCT